ncbi:MAG: pitrilysin family protein [Chitinophagaceae bacterium]
MKMKYPFLAAFSAMFVIAGKAQQVKFTEYDLANGLHVILHQDKSAPVVAVSVMYHVGSKDEDTARTGFAHFFEHLLFEGSDNIKRGEFMKIVSSNGGQNNANTSQDRTFYYEVFPSNQLQLGLWMESERMMHPVINEMGVKTQSEVVKEEKRLRIDNQPYAKFIYTVFADVFKEHPYRWPAIGSMAHLEAARLDEFIAFFKKYYIPNNAALSIAGDIDIEKTKAMVKAYFEPIPKGAPIQRKKIEERPLGRELIDTAYDANIQIPAIFATYRIPGFKSEDAKALEMISSILSGSGSSRLQTKLVDQKKTALQVAAINYPLEDYGLYITLALPNNEASLDDLLKDIDNEVSDMQKNLISETEYQKLQNRFENNFINSSNTMLGVAQELANGYTFYGNTNRINEELKVIKSVTREKIREVAAKYLTKDNRVVLYYLPQKQ